MRQKISGSVFWFKRLFPALYFGSTGVWLVLIFAAGDVAPVHAVVPLALAAFGFFIFHFFVWDLVDEAWDHGDHLRFVKGSLEQRVPFADIANIDYSYMSSPERVTIKTRRNGPLGQRVAFSLPLRLNIFRRAPVVNSLLERAAAARADSA